MDVPRLIELPSFSDDRGVLVPFTNWMTDLSKLRRVYLVANFVPGTIRGFHRHLKEEKYFVVTAGAAKFCVLDPTQAYPASTLLIFVQSVRKPSLLIVPPGWANGWMSLEAGTVLMAMSSATAEESKADDFRYDPFMFGDVWSVKPR